MAGTLTSLTRWLTEPVPRGRVAAFRTLVYLFVAADLVLFTPWVRTHAGVPGELYQPLFIGRLLPLPLCAVTGHLRASRRPLRVC